jgi:hypothetical protein
VTLNSLGTMMLHILFPKMRVTFARANIWRVPFRPPCGYANALLHIYTFSLNPLLPRSLGGFSGIRLLNYRSDWSCSAACTRLNPTQGYTEFLSVKVLHFIVGNLTRDSGQYRACNRDLSSIRMRRHRHHYQYALTHPPFHLCAQVIDGRSLFPVSNAL